MTDPRFASPVGGMDVPVLPAKLQSAIADLEKRFPKLGLALFVFDFGPGGGLSYISNAERDDMLDALREFINKNERGRN